MEGIVHKQINLQKLSPEIYSISWHTDWSVGIALHGGHLATAIHLAAADYLKTELARVDQPDILRLHFEFLRNTELSDSTITIKPIKIGSGTSALQLTLSQEGKLRVLAFATSVNFGRPFGPSIAADFILRPAPNPIPDFRLAESKEQSQPYWLSSRMQGDVLPCLGRLLTLGPRQGFPVDGVIDAWNHWEGDIPMDASYITLMTDCFASMSDTLLGNKGIYDIRHNHSKAVSWDKENPGKPITLNISVEEAFKATTFNSTLTLDIEFKRRVPENGISWAFTRISTKQLVDGRMDLDISICNEKMELIATANQTILVLDISRRFGRGKTEASL